MVSAVKIWSQKQCQKVKTQLCLKNQMQGLPEVIKRKTSLENMKTKIMAFVMVVIQAILMKTNIILKTRASLILGHFLLMELIVTYRTHSMKVYNM